MTTAVAIVVGMAVVFLVVLAGSIVRASRGWSALRRQSRRLRFVCDRCGYSREGLEGRTTCPECGQRLLTIDAR